MCNCYHVHVNPAPRERNGKRTSLFRRRKIGSGRERVKETPPLRGPRVARRATSGDDPLGTARSTAIEWSGMRRRNLAKNWARSLLASPGVRRIGRVVPRPLRRSVAALLARLDEPRTVRLRQLSADVESRLLKACAAETDAWRQIRSRVQWKGFLEPRLVSLRRSLGRPPARGELSPRITRTLEGNGFLIDNRRELP